MKCKKKKNRLAAYKLQEGETQNPYSNIEREREQSEQREKIV